MSTNIGVADRIVRLVVGILILGLYGALPGPWRYLTLVGLIPLGSVCPVRAALGRTRP